MVKVVKWSCVGLGCSGSDVGLVLSFGGSALNTNSGLVTPYRTLCIAFKSDKAKAPLFPRMISSVLILLLCPAQCRKMIRAMSCLQSWILCYFFPSLRHNRLGLFFHAGGPQASVKGERHVEPELREDMDRCMRI